MNSRLFPGSNNFHHHSSRKTDPTSPADRPEALRLKLEIAVPGKSKTTRFAATVPPQNLLATSLGTSANVHKVHQLLLLLPPENRIHVCNLVRGTVYKLPGLKLDEVAPIPHRLNLPSALSIQRATQRKTSRTSCSSRVSCPASGCRTAASLLRPAPEVIPWQRSPLRTCHSLAPARPPGM